MSKDDPKKTPKLLNADSQHLELIWNISKQGKPVKCECCNGTGNVECRFCNGTGVMTVGDTLYCSWGECMKCPVCNDEGTVRCKDCRGTGRRAAWIRSDLK